MLTEHPLTLIQIERKKLLFQDKRFPTQKLNEVRATAYPVQDRVLSRHSKLLFSYNQIRHIFQGLIKWNSLICLLIAV